MRRRITTLLACIGLAFLAINLIPPEWYGGFLARPWLDSNGNVLVVLGSDALDNTSMGQSSYWRCVCAAAVWRQGNFKQLIVSGDSAITTSMKDYLTWRGIPAEAIIAENRSLTTRENAVNTAKITAGMAGPFVLLTSDFHVWRASRAFAKAGMTAGTRPCPDAFKRSLDWRNRWNVFLTIAEEFVKIGYYRVRGWI
jgi:uncharacterized SAM-binding protein YcdF (DUF218 family)